ncbi:MAG: 2,3-diphosphoglycerate synthetase [Actinomycetota bacterium]|jgi:cyclic 2,3-diphosphoglycerate synthetase|nr:MAG: 2,3-diphosphoglycerate synthetase [Actinomycetota bacterium]
MRTVVLVDGEHYPPVTRWAIAAARERGYEVVLALVVGGGEKVGSAPLELGVPTRSSGPDRAEALAAVIRELRPEVVLDVSDEPVLGYRERLALASTALRLGVAYAGADFRLEPPAAEPAPAGVPTLAVIGTGKRTGKTAIAGELARAASRRGLDPIVVAMGRGGPPEPQVAEAGAVTLPALLELVRRGEHAASDYLEDALTTGVTTIGARRAGGGLAGAPFATNVPEAVAIAAARRPGVVILEGSGSAIPPVAWDAGILVVPATCPVEYVRGYLGPYRLLRSDLAVVTMAANPASGSRHLSDLTSYLRRSLGDDGVILTEFHPVPLADVRGKDAFFATTAPDDVAARQVERLQAEHGCRVVGWSARLADRSGLEADLARAEGFDVLLTELKAAAVDVAAERAIARGADVVFVDNRAEVIEGPAELGGVLEATLELAATRARGR